MIQWEEYIQVDSQILRGKPIVKETRLSVDFILGLYRAGWNTEQILANYPSLTPQALQAVFSFAAECLRGEAI